MDQLQQAIEIMKSKSNAPDPTTSDPASQVKVIAPVVASPAEPAAPKKDEPVPAAPAQASEAKPKEDAGEFAAKFAALARREKANLEKEQSLKQQAEKLKGKTVEDIRALAKKNPIEALKEAGLSYEEVTEYILSQGKETPEKKLTEIEQRVKQIEEKEIAFKKMEAEAKVNRAVDGFKGEIKSFVDTNNEKYELIKGNQAEQLVYDVIDSYFEKTKAEMGEGRVLSIEEACDEVERHFEEQVEKWRAFKKVQAKLAPKPVTAPATSESPAMKTDTQVTLTNHEAMAPKPVRTKPKTRDEEIEDAIKQLRFVKA